MIDAATNAAAGEFHVDTMTALESIGSIIFRSIGHRESYAILGVRNVAGHSGQVQEDNGVADPFDMQGMHVHEGERRVRAKVENKM